MKTTSKENLLGINFRRLLLSASAMLSLGAFAAPMNPKPFTVDNDGESITIMRMGDEHYHFTQTQDGYMIGQDSTGTYLLP